MLSRARDPILRRVAAVTALSATLAAVVVRTTAGEGSPLVGDLLVPASLLLPVLVVLTCLAELLVVRLRHGAAVEELTLYEAALIVDVLVLPPDQALLAAYVGLILASVLQRRPVVKALFNLGTYSAAVSCLILVVHRVGGTPGAMDARVLAGVVLGTLAFTAVNLCCLAQVLGLVGGVSPWRIVRSEARLSAYMALGTMATGLITVEVWRHAPLLLPFMAMPALAVTYAYRAAAQEADERARSELFLQLSNVLAERDDLVRRFLLLVREAFDADVATVVLHRAAIAQSVDAVTPGELHTGPVAAHWARFAGVDRPTIVPDGLPDGFRQLLVVPVDASGDRLGFTALGLRGRGRRRFRTRDMTLLAPLANALGAALREAEHLDRLVAETSKLHAIVEQSTEGIVMVDGQGRVLMWSRALAGLTSLQADHALGRPLAEVLQVAVAEERPLLLPVTPQRPQQTVELTMCRPDGERRRLRLAHSAVYAGAALVRDVVVISDLTREHRTERMKTDFIATVSHELRTPLTPIIGYVDLLRSRGDRMPPQKRTDALNLIADRAAHLSRLVDDLLLASKISDAEDDVDLHVSAGVHDLAGMARQVADDLNSRRVVVRTPEEPVPVRCDGGRALQVITNLVGNALKYSPDPEPVTVLLQVTGDHAELRVEDRGRGIPADELDKIFEKFHRVEDPMTMSTSGTGLGLFISRRLARAMGGDVAVSSTLNVGSAFTLTLRRAEAMEAAAGPA